MEHNQQNPGWRQRWDHVRASKKVVFWFAVGAVAVTLLVGFNWGGWVTSSSAQKTADVAARDAVVQRLAPMCVAQFNMDPAKDLKLTELKATSTWQRSSYVEKQSWAIMPGEQKSDSNVASECAKLLMQISQ